MQNKSMCQCMLVLSCCIYNILKKLSYYQNRYKCRYRVLQEIRSLHSTPCLWPRFPFQPPRAISPHRSNAMAGLVSAPHSPAQPWDPPSQAHPWGHQPSLASVQPQGGAQCRGLGLPQCPQLPHSRLGWSPVARPCPDRSPGEPLQLPHPNPSKPLTLTAPWHAKMKKMDISYMHARNISE